MSSLFTLPERNASRSPWVQMTEPLRSASFTRFEALILSRVRSRQHELPRANGRSSLGLSLSRAFSVHASNPRPARTRKPEHAPSSEDSRTRFEGPCDPPNRVRPSQTTEAPGNDLVGRFRPLEGRPAPPLGGDPTPLALAFRASPSPLTYEALKCVESYVSPKRPLALLRFPASSTPS